MFSRLSSRKTSALLAVVFTLPCAALTWGAQRVSWDADVRPILQRRCGKCHGDATQKGELNLSSLKALLAGGESGPVLEFGNLSESRLWEVLAAGEMPPEGSPKLTDKERQTIREWIRTTSPAEVNARTAPLNQHDVLPILLLHCSTCHGRQQQEGGLDVRTVGSLLKGGKSGPAIIPGSVDKSLIVQRIRREEMPPRAKLASHSVKPVSDSELERLSRWIEQGARHVAVMPDVASEQPDPLVTDTDRKHWSFQPPREPQLPPATQGNAHHPVDRFIAARLQDAGLELSPPATKNALIRRAYLDLTGLPPTPAQVDSFVADNDPLAYAKLVDRLLASPRYGERWGQYWLDLAGYADSEGIQHSDPVRPFAYRYRDYVIRALNADKSYDQFLLEQIAGDELADYRNADVIDQQLYDNLVATGFLRMTSDGTFAGITGFVPNRIDVIDDQLRVLSSSVMGLSIRCARCHSHKFDPIPQRDYYRLVALFKPAMDEHDWLKPVTGGAGNRGGPFRYLPHVTTAEQQRWQDREKAIDAEVKRLKEEKAQAKGNEELQKRIDEKIKAAESRRQPQPMIRALWDRGQPSPTYLLRRGDHLQPTRLMGPGVPSALTDGRTPFPASPPWPGAETTGNRLALARWLTQPDHPLTARVIVNRLWKHHFGRGIVETLDDFGRAGAKPTHPKLLDWLAVDFVRNGWSIKHLHRLLMTSGTYRQTTDTSAQQRRADPDNRLLSRMPLRRMDAELLRDSLLAVANRLDRSPFGPADGVEARGDGLVTSTAIGAARRRSIFVLKRRTQRLTILDSFDRPAMSPNCVDRTVSIVAPQALFLMNNKMVHELSLALARRISRETPAGGAERLRRLYMIAVSRQPTAQEEQVLLEALTEFKADWRTKLSPDLQDLQLEQAIEERAWGNVCHAVMNSAAFLYVE